MPEEQKPEWLDDANEVLSFDLYRGATRMPAAEDAFFALNAAGIPAFLELRELPKEDVAGVVEATHQIRLLVPGKFNYQATGVLERDVSNPEFEQLWKTHLEMLSDEEVRSMSPEIAFCGLLDRIARVKKVYAGELARRGRKA